MTEKIIIDGVDVAGCKFYIADDKYSCDLSFINQEELCKCDDVQDCYYKQLKRLEQENKELKKDLKSQQMTNLKQQEIALDYWNALEKIKDLCIHYENTNDKCITNCYAHFIVTDLIQDKINEVLG